MKKKITEVYRTNLFLWYGYGSVLYKGECRKLKLNGTMIKLRKIKSSRDRKLNKSGNLCSSHFGSKITVVGSLFS